MTLLLTMKGVIGVEYINTEATNLSEITPKASTVIFAHFSFNTIPKAAFTHIPECKTLVFFNTKTKKIDQDAWRGLNNLESLSIEESFMKTIDSDVFAHLKVLSALKLTTISTGEFSYFSADSIPVKTAAFRGLDSLSSLWLSMSNLNEHTFRNMGRKVWADISDTLSELLLPGNDFTNLFRHMLLKFSNLKKLSFRSNRITIVFPGAFHGLKLLKEIDLAKNKINEIAHNTF